MKNMPVSGTRTNDVVYTPRALAAALVAHFRPQGFGLDPSAGDGAFFDRFGGRRDWCEISRGRDFFEWNRRVDYVMTNPPWSLMRRFLLHSYEIADDVYFLVTLGHCFTRARINDALKAGFGIRELCMCATPKDGKWPSTGLQLGMAHWKRGWTGDIKLTRIEY